MTAAIIDRLTHQSYIVNVNKEEAEPVLRGWGNYFVHGRGITFFKVMDSWIRRRLRAVQQRSRRKVRKPHQDLRRRKFEGELPQLRMTA